VTPQEVETMRRKNANIAITVIDAKANGLSALVSRAIGTAALASTVTLPYKAAV